MCLLKDSSGAIYPFQSGGDQNHFFGVISEFTTVIRVQWVLEMSEQQVCSHPDHLG